MSINPIARFARALLIALFAATATASYAHHSFGAEFDSNKPVKLTGVVTRLEWTNPHVYLWIDVADKGGKTRQWGFEMGPPHMLQKAGWKKNSLTLGETVEIEGWAARDGSNHANARMVKRTSTGEVLGAASSGGQTLTGAAKPGAAAKPAGSKP
ncbi:MAG: DUF6152 family protein [Gammaproteobacteria bacterium]